MAIRAAHVVAPVLAAAIVVVLFFARVAGQASFGFLFRRFACESPNLRLVAAAFNVSFARPVTGFAALFFGLPASVRELAREWSLKSY